MVGGRGGEEEMQFLRSAADSSDSLAAIITHFIYASQRNQEKKKVQVITEAATGEHPGRVVDSANRFK